MEDLLINNKDQNKPSISARIETNFFSITRWAVFLAASFAILTALGIVGSLIFSMTRSVNLTITPKTPTYAELKANLQQQQAQEQTKTTVDTAVLQKEQAAAQAQQELEYEKKLQPYVDKAFAGLTTYARALGQASPSRDGIREHIRKNMQLLARSMEGSDIIGWKYVEAFGQACADIAADAERLAKLPEKSPARLEYPEFIGWFDKNFFAAVQNEGQRIYEEQNAIRRAQAEVNQNLIIAGGAFGIFTILTFLLVLLRIERNTRSSLA